MKFPLLSLSLLTAVLLPSCEVMDTGYSTGSYYGGGGYVSRPAYYNTYDSDYYNYGYAGRPYDGGYYRSGRYYNRYGVYCPPEQYHKHSSHSSSNHSGSAIKLIRGNDGDHPNRPEGYHSKEWYKQRGYDLSDYTHKHRDGEVHKGGDKKKDDDKNKKHKH
jgi:hypothetical protein